MSRFREKGAYKVLNTTAQERGVYKVPDIRVRAPGARREGARGAGQQGPCPRGRERGARVQNTEARASQGLGLKQILSTHTLPSKAN